MSRQWLSPLLATLVAAAPTYAEAESQVEKALGQQTELEFVATPLDDALSFLSDRHNVQIKCDTAAFAKAKRKTDDPVNHILKGISLRSGLNILTHEIGCEYRVEDDRIVVVPEGMQKRPGGGKPAPPRPRPKGNERIRKVLESETGFEFEKTPLKDALTFLATIHGTQVVLDNRAIREAKIDLDAGVTAKSAPGGTLKNELKKMLGPFKLEARVENEVVFITTAPAKPAGKAK
jgi:hypothetical protein